MVSVPNKGGTGTPETEPKWYQYQDKVVSVPLTRTGLVPVPIQVVLVPLFPTALIFGILTLLSSNSHTEGIGTIGYIKVRHLYRVLSPSTHVLLSFCIE